MTCILVATRLTYRWLRTGDQAVLDGVVVFVIAALLFSPRMWG